jgi:hypothetical protein
LYLGPYWFEYCFVDEMFIVLICVRVTSTFWWG